MENTVKFGFNELTFISNKLCRNGPKLFLYYINLLGYNKQIRTVSYSSL